MTRLSLQTATSLQQLVNGCRTAAQFFRRAANEQEDSRLQTLLSNYAQLRTQLASELERCVSSSEITAPTGTQARVRIDADSLAKPIPDGDALADCRLHDEHTLKQYQWLLKRDLPPTLRQIVSRQHAAVQGDLQRLCELIGSTDGIQDSGSRPAIH